MNLPGWVPLKAPPSCQDCGDPLEDEEIEFGDGDLCRGCFYTRVSDQDWEEQQREEAREEREDEEVLDG